MNPRSANRLLASLSPADFASLEPDLEAASLEVRRVLEEANAAVEYAYFPTEGLVSVVAVDENGHRIEAGVVGNEGMTATSVVLGDDRSPNTTFVQIAGTSVRMAVKPLRAVLVARRGVRDQFLRFAHVFGIQVGQTALANGRANVVQRLARWLLMAQDRMGGSNLSLTHEFLALMLGVRRAGVTVALHELEGEGLIRAVRGTIVVSDRDGLLDVADGYYGAPEKALKRLLKI